MKNRIMRISLFCAGISIGVILILFCEGCAEVKYFGKEGSMEKSDAILVLGAAVWGNHPSPIFKERINHAINLYKNGRSQKIIFTGGRKFASDKGEANVAKRYAIEHGVPAGDILVEDMSNTTVENIYFSKGLLDSMKLKKIILVSDPYHMRRACLIARDAGFEPIPSPTPTSKIRSKVSKLTFLSKESYLLWLYRLSRMLNK